MKKFYIILSAAAWTVCMLLSLISAFTGGAVRYFVPVVLLILGGAAAMVIYSGYKSRLSRDEDDAFMRREMALQRLIAEDTPVGHEEFTTRVISGSDEALFPNDGFCLIAFSVDDYDEAVLGSLYDQGLLKYPDMDCSDIVQILIRRELGDIMESRGLHAECTAINWDLFCIVNFPYSPEENASTLFTISQCCQELTKRLKAQYSAVISSSVSSVGQGVGSVPDLYNEVLQIGEYKKIFDLDEPLLMFTEMSIAGPNSGSSGASTYSVPDGGQTLEQHRIFVNCMLAHDYTAAKAVITNIIATELSASAPVIELAQYRLHSIIDMLISAFDSIKDDIGQELYSSLFPQISLTEIQTAEELSEKVDYIFNVLIEHSQLPTAQAAPEWVGKMKEYVAEQYTNPDLNVNLVAMHFDLNPAYTSRSFKLYAGVGLLDYIHSVRISHAKELLAAGSTVKEAAERSGFSNTRSMNRAFIKYEGITPGKVAKAKASA